MYRITALFFGLIFTLSAHALDAGKKAPDFDLPGLKNVTAGKNYRLSDYQGNVIYVDFWASWCGPCKRSFPALNNLHNKYKDQGFEVVAINLDENLDDALTFLKQVPVDFPVVRDAKGTIATSYNLKGMPSAYLLDQEGNVFHAVIGFNDKEPELIESKIKQLLGN